MKLTKEDLKYPQIDAAFRYIYDNIDIYSNSDFAVADMYEFGVGSGASINKMIKYIEANLHVKDMWPNIYGFDSFEGLPSEQDGVEVFSKFTKGSYKFNQIDHNRSEVPVFIQKCWFQNAKFIDDMEPALLVHIDCDLYTSTIDAFKFLLENKLVVKGTLVAYDEFRSTNDPLSGGESKAHLEFFQPSLWQSGMDCVEVWHNIYSDKDTGQSIRQSLFEVI